MQQIRLNFLFHLDAVQEESKKVVYAATYLRGAAFDWFEPYIKDKLSNLKLRRGPNTIQMFQNFNYFVTAIDKVYKDTDTTREATKDIQTLRQHRSVTDYAFKFHQLSSRIS